MGALLLLVAAAAAGCHPAAERAAGQQAVSDATVSAAVQAVLTADRKANFARVDVDSQGGVVTLSGSVRSEQERSRAETLARRVEGVNRVNNYLMIQREPQRAGTPHE